MALALALAMLRMSRSPLLRRLLENRNVSNSAFVAARSYISVSERNEDFGCINTYGGSADRTVEFNIRQGVFDQSMEHPWQVEGPSGTFEAKKVEEGLFVRIDMPGIAKNDEIQLWNEYDKIFIKGVGKKKSMNESNARIYSGSVDVSPGHFDMNKIKAGVECGVFRMLIPKKESDEMKNPNLIRFDHYYI